MNFTQSAIAQGLDIVTDKRVHVNLRALIINISNNQSIERLVWKGIEIFWRKAFCAALTGETCRAYTCLQLWLFTKFHAVMKDMISNAPPSVFRYFLCPYCPLTEVYKAYTEEFKGPIMSAASTILFSLMYFICIMDFLQAKNMLQKMKLVGISAFIFIFCSKS